VRPVSTANVFLKYADDINLLVPEHTDVELDVELSAINAWSTKNMMIINYSKTNEIVFHRLNLNMHLIIPSLPGIEQIEETKLLGCHILRYITF
jgi:hypothetical protein